MLRRALLSLALLASSPLVVVANQESHEGFAAHYRPGLMERVAHRRGLPIVGCMVATPYHKLGTWIQVYSHKAEITLTCRVTDVPHPKDHKLLKARKIVVELDFPSAKILCQIRYVRQEPPRACPVLISPAPRT